MTIFEISVKARELGMTYGKYVLSVGPIDAEPEETGRQCVQCGKLIPASRIKASNSHFCSERCRAKRSFCVNY